MFAIPLIPVFQVSLKDFTSDTNWPGDGVSGVLINRQHMTKKSKVTHTLVQTLVKTSCPPL